MGVCFVDFHTIYCHVKHAKRKESSFWAQLNHSPPDYLLQTVSRICEKSRVRASIKILEFGINEKKFKIRKTKKNVYYQLRLGFRQQC